jgi:hypothetical protein
MNKMNSENEEILLPVTQSIEKLSSSLAVKEMTIAQLRDLGNSLHDMIENIIFEKVKARTEIALKFQNMTNEQFEAYLKAKYGDKWMFTSLTPDEFARVPNLSQEDLEKALEEGYKERQLVTQFS